MIGGYLGYTLVSAAKLDVLPALAASAAATMALGALAERTVYRWVYATGELGQILMTLGLTFIMVAAANLAWGSDLHAMPLSLTMTRDLHLVLQPGFIILTSV
jgi:branched-chain amino acid transport system permease protein